ncbi:uncharacterized protein BXZ73DRAFT_100658 [Epithele typhae]|uniref:uncharacterized protein n=1 Tax=Epithele typhae TaxID=378194 RepID=UPI002008278B|nr:uncharacterized protein BXZ73DRAFT_100658 [Epithele typhae]KAH9934466.1 hypothetical protein BXZ73DRAFT_100658 [Epithele typhae]
MSSGDRSLRIACRLVCADQWLVTHVDPDWSILDLKHFLLQKFSGSPNDDRASRVPPPSRTARRRSLSPITFANPAPQRKAVTSSSSDESDEHSDLSDGLEDAGDDVDISKSLADAHRYKYTAQRPSTSSTSDVASQPPQDPRLDAHAYLLLSFSTTQLLEDRFSLAWYGVSPNELLELHPQSVSFASLSRGSLDAYIVPYFAVRVWALRIVGHKIDATRTMLTKSRRDDNGTGESTSSREKGKRKVALEWKERWAVIHQGLFSLCKDRHDRSPAFCAPLSSLESIRDNTTFSIPHHARRHRHKMSKSASTNVLSLKFKAASRGRHRLFSDDVSGFISERRSSEPQVTPLTPTHSPTLSAGQGGWWRRGSRDVTAALSLGLTSSASVLVGAGNGTSFADAWDSIARRGGRAGTDEQEGSGHRKEGSKEKLKDKDDDADTVWVILDMLDESATSNILRVLHRHASPTCHSTFLPSDATNTASYSPAPLPIIFSSRSSTPIVGSTEPPPDYTFPPSSPSTSSHTLASSVSYPWPADDKFEDAHADPPPPTVSTSFPSVSAPVDYPGWRLSVVRAARRAGLGSVGRAMQLVMFGDEDDDADAEDNDTNDELAIEWARRNSSADPSPIDRPPHSMSTFSSLTPRPSIGYSPVDSPTPRPNDPSTIRPFFPRRASHPLVDLSSDPGTDPESDGSEVEWDGWMEQVIAQRHEDELDARDRARLEAFACTDAVPASPGSAPVWTSGWTTHFGGGDDKQYSHSTSSVPDRDPVPISLWSSRKDSDPDLDTEDSSTHSSDFNARGDHSRRTVSGGLSMHSEHSSGSSTRGRHARTQASGSGHARTLSSYSSVDSLLRRTMRTNMQGLGNTARQASIHALFPSASEASLPPLPGSPPVPIPMSAVASKGRASRSPERSSPSPPPYLTRPSMGSMHSCGSARSRPLSPLSTQLRDTGMHEDEDEDEDRGEDGSEDYGDVDDVEEGEDADGSGELVESELGHVPLDHGVRAHPIPLPGMRIVPMGYTTFQHASLYGADAGGEGRSGGRAQVHAGIAHGQTMQRLPMGMSRPVTTVTSTVSVGAGARKGKRG